MAVQTKLQGIPSTNGSLLFTKTVHRVQCSQRVSHFSVYFRVHNRPCHFLIVAATVTTGKPDTVLIVHAALSYTN